MKDTILGDAVGRIICIYAICFFTVCFGGKTGDDFGPEFLDTQLNHFQ
jgi:hypothetical protein